MPNLSDPIQIGLVDHQLTEVASSCNGLCAETSMVPLLDYAASNMGCRNISVALRKPCGKLYTAAAIGLGEEYVGETLGEQCASAAVMRFGKPAILDMNRNPELRVERGDYKTDEYLGVPIFLLGDSKPAGVLNITDIDGGISQTLMDHLVVVSLYLARIVDRSRSVGNQARNLLKALDAKDHYTGGHCGRVTKYSEMIASAMELPPGDLFRLETYGQIHDLGKIGVPDGILNKSGRLTDEEFGLVMKHPGMGCEILEDHTEDVAAIAQHHDRWDGNGYGTGKRGLSISQIARIMAVADAFDAMTTDRPYRNGMSTAKAAEEIKKGGGSQFDPGVVDAFLRLLQNNPGAIEKIKSSS